MNRRAFNEALVPTLSLPASEREGLMALARAEAAAFARSLVTKGLLTPESLRGAFETFCGVPPFRREAADARPVPSEILPLPFLRARLLVPVSLEDGKLVVAMAAPLDIDAREAVARATGRRVEVVAGTEEEIREAIERIYGEGSSSMERLVEQVGDESEAVSGEDDKVERLIGEASEAPIIRLVNFIIARAIERSASDIHLEPYEKTLRVRYRIDGMLADVDAPPEAAPDRGHLPGEDHGPAEHRGEPPPPGRADQAPHRGQGDRLPGLDDPDAVRRERRHPDPRPGVGPADHAPARQPRTVPDPGGVRPTGTRRRGGGEMTIAALLAEIAREPKILRVKKLSVNSRG